MRLFREQLLTQVQRIRSHGRLEIAADIPLYSMLYNPTATHLKVGTDPNKLKNWYFSLFERIFITSVFPRLCAAISDLLFPRICISCTQLCEKGRKVLCHHCFSELVLIPPESRCRRCFHPLIDCHGYRKRHTCFSRALPIKRFAFCFEETEVMRPLLNFLCSEAIEEKACRTLASFFALQHLRLDFPRPDLLIIPSNCHPLFIRPAFGREVCHILDVPSLIIFQKNESYRKLSLDSHMSHSRCQFSEEIWEGFEGVSPIPFEPYIRRDMGEKEEEKIVEQPPKALEKGQREWLRIRSPSHALVVSDTIEWNTLPLRLSSMRSEEWRSCDWIALIEN